MRIRIEVKNTETNEWTISELDLDESYDCELTGVEVHLLVLTDDEDDG